MLLTFLIASIIVQVVEESNKMFNKIVAENESDLIIQLSKLIEKVSNSCISENNAFNVGVSGGSLVKFLTAGLPKIKTDFSKWRIFFCDERVVPVDSADSTFGVYKKDLIGKVPLLEEQFVKIKDGVSADEAAKDYNEKLTDTFKNESVPRFDMLLLGMGPDGHTCSLFPGHALLDETEMWVAPITDSPKPPSCRVTLTFPVINNAKYCVFAMAGDSKADMVRRILIEKDDLPATRVKPTNGELYWILDKAAAKHL